MNKMSFSACDKLAYKILHDYGCQTSNQIRVCMNRWYDESFTASSIVSSLRKMAIAGRAASSENERGQKVYWLTDWGMDLITQMMTKEEL